MNLAELKAQLTKKIVQPLYIFTGEEVAIRDVYIDLVAKASGSVIVRLDSVSDVYKKANAQSFIKQRNCYVISNDTNWMKEEKHWTDLDTGIVQGNHVVILTYPTLDKRTKFYGRHTRNLVEFERLSEDVLAKYIYRDSGLALKYGKQLADMCNYSYSRIKLECDKLMHLSVVRGVTIDEAFLLAVQEKLIYSDPQDVVFELIDSICHRHANASYKLLEELNGYNTQPLAIISLLYSNVRSMMLYQSSKDAVNIGERTGLTGWQIKLAKEKGNNYTLNELLHGLRVIREAEKGIKTGQLEIAIAVEYILINIL